MNTPWIIASENGGRGARAAMELLKQGKSALDAVEVACTVVEDDPEDHSVGYGGTPNALAAVELDASIMDGITLRAGAVAALSGYGNPTRIARRLMETLPHVLLAGDGAARFAAEQGFEPAVQLTDAALARWRQRYEEHHLVPPGTPPARRAPGARVTGLVEAVNTLTKPIPQDLVLPPGHSTTGTVNFLALDGDGNIASAVSTSGLGWKYPGRTGDSPIIGAGNYCDNRYGAAACIGLGELSLRVSTARSVILYLKAGMDAAGAGTEAMYDLAYLREFHGESINIIILTPAGTHAGFTTMSGRNYLAFCGDMAQPEVVARTVITGSPA